MCENKINNRPYTKVKDYTFNDKKYRMLWRKHPVDKASCDDPTTEESRRNMFIDPTEPSKEFLETVLHEATHAEQFYLDEPTVQRIGKELSTLLWNIGFRLTDGKGNIVDRAKEQ